MRRHLTTLLALSTNLFLCQITSAQCPDFYDVPDWNCDQKLVISVFGDSLVSGFGDKPNNNLGGYVLRAQERLPAATLHNLGIAGLKTRPAISKLKRELSAENSSDFKDAILESDLFVIDLGRNDRWLFGTPLATWRNLKRISTIVQQAVSENNRLPPLVVTAVLMLPNRGSQGPWVKELNSLILKSNKLSTPADLRFDLVSKRLLGPDQIHPTAAGYAALAKVLVKYLTKTLPARMTKLIEDRD